MPQHVKFLCYPPRSSRLYRWAIRGPLGTLALDQMPQVVLRAEEPFEVDLLVVSDESVQLAGLVVEDDGLHNVIVFSPVKG